MIVTTNVSTLCCCVPNSYSKIHPRHNPWSRMHSDSIVRSFIYLDAQWFNALISATNDCLACAVQQETPAALASQRNTCLIQPKCLTTMRHNLLSRSNGWMMDVACNSGVALVAFSFFTFLRRGCQKERGIAIFWKFLFSFSFFSVPFGSAKRKAELDQNRRKRKS